MRTAYEARITPEEAGRVLREYDKGLTAREAANLINEKYKKS
jgi:hypothetical protein